MPASARPPLSLQHDAAPRLVEVQAALARDATAWSRGALSTPASLQSLLRSSLSLLDALASLQVAVSTCSTSPPAAAAAADAASAAAAAAAVAAAPGRRGGLGLTGGAHLCFVRPLAPATAEVFAALRAAASAAADHLDAVSSSRTAWSGLASFFSGEMGPPRSERKRKGALEAGGGGGGGDRTHRRGHHHREANAATRARLRAAIDDLRARRSVAIEAQSAARRLFHVAMARNASSKKAAAAAAAASAAKAPSMAANAAGALGEEKEEEGKEEERGSSAFVLPQDQLRHLATMSALIKAMNRFTAVLRAAAAC